ncbi:hypothetical protein WJX84_003379 [Apatococcus fuscideae]|uniref:Uncharacterized protein n=1 Tax=Apatococcus fuscideae TaxID=2026836 RepID=A0AAW1SN27_9CHLO
MQVVQPNLGDDSPWSFRSSRAASIVAQAKQRLQAGWLKDGEGPDAAAAASAGPQTEVTTAASLSPVAKEGVSGESMPAYLARMNGLLAQVEEEHQQRKAVAQKGSRRSNETGSLHAAHRLDSSRPLTSYHWTQPGRAWRRTSSSPTKRAAYEQSPKWNSRKTADIGLAEDHPDALNEPAHQTHFVIGEQPHTGKKATTVTPGPDGQPYPWSVQSQHAQINTRQGCRYTPPRGTGGPAFQHPHTQPDTLCNTFPQANSPSACC